MSRPPVALSELRRVAIVPALNEEHTVPRVIAEDIERCVPMLGRQRDVKHRAILGGVGVDLAAEVAGFPHDVARRARRRALENHVFDEVREAAAEELLLVDRAGADPDLHRRHRRAVVLLDQQDHAVIQHDAPQTGIRLFQNVQGIHDAGAFLFV